ncbi:MAG: thioredoxin-disulfide reductase [Firmicutes bacterium HGW-Firmicutes-12]|nr:MAG: thioredoxin-disulfide reductase [Firmicutes bacterium HGW-Firmicutes-12]
MKYDVIIIGGGPGGLTAAIYACRAGWKTALLERGAPGGQAASTDIIENYPGFVEGVSGPELMMNFYNQALRFNCEFITADVMGLEVTGPQKKIITSQGQFEGKTIIIATGASHKAVGVEGEQRLRGKGISYCATCDGFFFRGKKVAVIGGGDSAVKEAIYLANLAEEVTIIHRRDAFRAAKILVDKALQTPNIKVLWDSVVDEMIGDNHLEKLRIQNVKTKEITDLQVNGAFLYVGTQPNTTFLDSDYTKNPQGYLITNHKLETSVAGVFAVGDCCQKESRQVATAVGDGAMVLPALEAYLHAL